MLKIIALGNELRGDDSIGPYLLNKLEETEHPIPIRFIHAGADTFMLLEHLMGEDPVVIIDCARMGKTSGSVCKFRLDEVNIKQVDKAVSLHGFSFAEIWNMASRIGPVAPCTIVGIEPEQTEIAMPLSASVRSRIPQAMHLLQEEINRYVN